MEDQGTIIFVEVRYRKNANYGSALESVTYFKQLRIVACAGHYLSYYDVDKPARFDVIAITHERGEMRLQWVRDAFQV